MKYVTLIIIMLLTMMTSCKNMPPVEVCYTHPKYGEVCLKLNGHEFQRKDLSPAEQKEVDAWIKDQEAKKAAGPQK